MAFVRDEFKLLAKLLVPVVGLSQAAVVLSRRDWLTGSQGEETWLRSVSTSGVYGSSNFSAGQAWAAIAWSLASIVIAGTVAIVIHRWLTQPQARLTPKSLGVLVIRRMPVIIGVWIVTHLVELAGFLYLSVLIVPVVAVTLPVALFESLGPWKAVRRSMHLAHGRYWSITGPLLLVTLACVGVSAAAAVVPGRITDLLGITPDWWVWWIVGTATASVTMPVIGATSAFLYLDLRSRLEGLDIELDLVDCFGVPNARR